MNGKQEIDYLKVNLNVLSIYARSIVTHGQNVSRNVVSSENKKKLREELVH